MRAHLDSRTNGVNHAMGFSGTRGFLLVTALPNLKKMNSEPAPLAVTTPLRKQIDFLTSFHWTETVIRGARR
jgi:hypothetical protein